MPRKKTGLNKHQKAAHRRGEMRVSREEVETLLEMSKSGDPEQRLVSANYLCPCHVRRRTEAVREALYRMLEDPDVRVRRAAWHTLEDGGCPEDPVLDPIFERALETEMDPKVRRFVDQFARPRLRQKLIALELPVRSEFTHRGKCDFCGESNVFVKKDFDTFIPSARDSRTALICQPCDNSCTVLQIQSKRVTPHRSTISAQRI